MIDMTALIADYLASDADVIAASLPIHADEIPVGATYPLVLVRALSVQDAVPPVDVWERHEMQVDVVGIELDFPGAVDATSVVRRKVHDLRGVVGSVVIAGAVVVATTRVTDDSVSPARPRWVLAVEVTARATT